MVFYALLALVVVGLAAWLWRSPLMRAHRRGHGRDPGEAGTRMEGKFGAYGSTSNRTDRPI
jgi:hypothetical protein